jgi:hypothetical protein
MERIGPVPVEIRADPLVTEPDSALGIIPAQRLTFDLAANGTFKASGQRVELSYGRGQVTFLSKDPVSENPIPAGAQVSTPNGIRFLTSERVVIPPATIVGLTIVPGEVSVRVRAARAGPAGNVEANAITVIPSGEDPTFTEVRNPDPTTGGRRRVFPKVVQADIDAALKQLRGKLGEEFAAILADPNRVPAGLQLFPATQVLADPVATADPKSLLDQEVAEFELGLATTGSVTAVDPSPVEEMARQRIAGSVDPGYRLVDGSVETTPGEPAVDGQLVSFPVSASGAQIRVVDADSLRKEVKGKTINEARTILEQYGLVDIRAWPDWVTSIPTNDSRVTLRVVTPGGAGEPEEPGSSSSPDADSSGFPAEPLASGEPGPSSSAGAPAPEPSASALTGVGGEAPGP